MLCDFAQPVSGGAAAGCGQCAGGEPGFLFETPEDREHGAIFWPDIGSIGEHEDIWKITGVDYRDEPEFASGQMVIDKARCWRALQVAMHLNEHSEWWYRLTGRNSRGDGVASNKIRWTAT